MVYVSVSPLKECVIENSSALQERLSSDLPRDGGGGVVNFVTLIDFQTCSLVSGL